MNKIENNITKNNVIENQVNNKIENNNNVITEKNNNGNENNINDTEIQTLSDEEKALKLVKDDWGTTDGVYFKIENISGNGNYEIVVRDSNTTSELAWYTVNPKTGKISK